MPKQKQSVVLLVAILFCWIGCEDHSNGPSINRHGPFGKDMTNPDFPSDSMPLEWIKPMWMSLNGPSPSNEIYDSCGMGLLEGQKEFTAVPPGVSAIKLQSNGKYIAHVEIFNKDSVLKQDFMQTFGYCGELANPNRQVAGGFVSYIGWDRRNNKGVVVEESVLVWKIIETFENGSQIQKIFSVENR